MIGYQGNNSNIGYICTGFQCEQGRGAKVAMRWIPSHGDSRDYTFAELDSESNRFANVLSGLGMQAGDVVFTFLPKMPEQFFAFLGGLKRQCIVGTLFANFGEEALLDRLGDACARCVITKKGFLKKLLRIRDRLPCLEHIILVDGDVSSNGIWNFGELMDAASPQFKVPHTAPDVPSVLHYTSGSTGKPKGVVHRHNSILNQNATSRSVLDITSDDIYWCTADQGWVTGTSYGIIGPWSLGVTQLHYGGGYDAATWLGLLERERVSVWYTAPTALRMLMREAPDLFVDRDLSSLRHVFSVGEPLNPEVINWAQRVMAKEIYDTWFQTETGGIMIANRPGLPIRPGSMGMPVENVEAAIIADDGRIAATGETGNLCIKRGWPSMFAAYLNNETAYDSKFRDGWYYTGDTAWVDCDGYFWFVGRSDDVINTAGHLVSPFEVESALLEIEEIVESGVVGLPDELLFEKVVAFVHLHPGSAWSRELELKIRFHVSNRVSTLATPQEIHVVDGIPKNKSGKIMRRVLKARYLGSEEGDISTLEI